MSNIVVNYLAQTGLDEKHKITEEVLFADAYRYEMILGTSHKQHMMSLTVILPK